MADRTVRAIIEAQVTGFETGMARAAATATKTGATIDRSMTEASRAVDSHSEAWNRVGNTMLTMGAIAIGGLAAVGKAAVDWQSDFAGVAKAVGLTDPMLNQLEGSLRGLARTMAASHSEIAQVATTAAQLGVKTPDIAKFTETMLMLGQTTTMTADDAATALAQLMTVMGTAPNMIGRLGATLVELGNNGASTEGQIVYMAQRIAAAGRQMGLTEAEVMGFASAIASTGINVEAGGTAMSRVFMLLDKAVRQGGDALATASEIAGTDFAQAFGTDAAGATVALVQGLDKLRKSGGDVNGALSDMGIKGSYNTDVLKRLASSGGLLAEQLSVANRGFNEGTALIDAYKARAETAAAKIQVAWNNIKDAAITAGAVLLPIISGIAQGVAGMAEAFGNLPGPVQTAMLVIGGLVGSILLIGGAVAKSIGGISDLSKALSAISGGKIDLIGSIASGISGIGGAAAAASVALGPLIAIVAVGATALAVFAGEQQRSAQNTADFTTALRASNGALDENVARQIAAKLSSEGAADAAATLGISLGTLTASVMGNKAAIAEVTAAIDAYKNETTDAKGPLGQDWGQAASSNAQAASQLEQSLGRVTGEFKNAVAANDAGTIAAKTATGAMVAQGDAASRSADQLKELTDAIYAQISANLALGNAELGYESAVLRATQAAKDNGVTLDTSTAAGIANKQALLDLAGASQRYISTLIEQGASTAEITAATEAAQKQFYEAAYAMTDDAAQAQELTDAYMAVPKDVQTAVTQQGAADAQKAAEDFLLSLQNLPPERRAEILSIFHDEGIAAARAAVASIQDKTVTITVNTVNGMSTSSRGGVTNADGGIWDFYANGGMWPRRPRANAGENHFAQVVPAGSYRTFAETETGGEAYLPLALSKRNATRPIAETAVFRLGGTIQWDNPVPIGANQTSSINTNYGTATTRPAVIELYGSDGILRGTFEGLMKDKEHQASIVSRLAVV